MLLAELLVEKCLISHDARGAHRVLGDLAKVNEAEFFTYGLGLAITLGVEQLQQRSAWAGGSVIS